MSFLEPPHTQKEIEILKKLISGSVKKGYLLKQGGTNKGWKKRWFCLKGATLYYFESSSENKLLGKFSFDSQVEVTEVNDKRKDVYCFSVNPNSRTRFLATETMNQRKDWIEKIKDAINSQTQENQIKEGILLKQGPKGGWKKRFVVLQGSDLYYFRQHKDIIPAGIVPLVTCISVSMVPNGKPFCFAVEHPSRVYYFLADTEGDMNAWIQAIRAQIGNNLQKLRKKQSSMSLFDNSNREVFTSKPLKEGILNKMKKKSQFKQTKPIRMALSQNFLYYFPIPGSTQKYHSIHLEDCEVEEIPSEMAKMPFSFRVVNLLHPLYLGAEEEKEFKVWVNSIQKVKENLQFMSTSKTDDEDIKTSLNIDYTVEVMNEEIDSNMRDVGLCKRYNFRVNAFWTSWIVNHSYEEIYNLYKGLIKDYSSVIFPEAPEKPLYLNNITHLKQEEKRTSIVTTLSSLIGSEKKMVEVSDPEYDLKFIRCLMREILQNRNLSQTSSILEFFELHSIYCAIKQGEISFLRYFLDHKKENANCTDSSGLLTPLISAIKTGNRQIIEAIIDYGADPNFPNKKKQTPLHTAAEMGNLEILQLLIDRGANINSKELSIPLLHSAIRGGRKEVVLWLIDKGADVNLQDEQGRTPLHIAVLEGSLDLSKVLLEKCALIETKDSEGFTPLMMACWNSKAGMVQIFLEKKANVNALDNNGRSCVHLCVLRKDLTTLQLLRESKAKFSQLSGSGFSPLHLAIKKGLNEIATFICRTATNSDDISIQDSNNMQTALHLAVSTGNTEITSLLLNLSPELVNIADGNGRTPLFVAIENTNFEIVQMLIHKNANVDCIAQKSNKERPVHVACASGNLDILKLLLSRQAAYEGIPRGDGSQPLHLAAGNGHESIVNYLLSVKCEVNVRDCHGNTPVILAQFVH